MTQLPRVPKTRDHPEWAVPKGLIETVQREGWLDDAGMGTRGLMTPGMIEKLGEDAWVIRVDDDDIKVEVTDHTQIPANWRPTGTKRRLATSGKTGRKKCS